MKFTVDSIEFDDEASEYLGSGQFGEVFGHREAHAAKLLYEAPNSEQALKLTQLTTLGKTLAVLPDTTSRLIALPKELAIGQGDNLAGYEMLRVDAAAKLFQLYFDPVSNCYREKSGVQLTDDVAVRVVIDLFTGLHAMHGMGLVIGDVAPQNILLTKEELRPCFIDLDDACFEGHLSSSLGTPGYVDPRLLDLDRNECDGFQFDAPSDVFALTAIAFQLFFGFDPFEVFLEPHQSDPDFARKNNLSAYRLFRQGLDPLGEFGLTLSNDAPFKLLNSRLKQINAIGGAGGADGEKVIAHFDAVYVDDRRTNLLELLDEGDSRRPEFSAKFDLTELKNAEILKRWNVSGVLNTLSELGGTAQVDTSRARSYLGLKSRGYDPDPRPFDKFLRARGLELGMMVQG